MKGRDKMDLKDMGYKDSVSMAVNEKQSEPKVRYPSFSLHKNIPEELMSKDIGEVCRIELVVKVIGKSIDQYSEDRHERLELEIHKLGFIGKAGKLSKEEYLGKSEEERAKYDKERLESKENEEPEEEE